MTFRLFARPREGGVCCERVLHTLVFTIPPLSGAATLRPHLAPFPRLPAVPELPRCLSPPPLAVTIRAGPRRAREGGRCASRNDALPAHRSSHASHGGTPHPGEGQRRQKDSWDEEWDGEVAVSPPPPRAAELAQHPLSRVSAAHRSFLEPAGLGSASRWTGASQRPSAAPPTPLQNLTLQKESEEVRQRGARPRRRPGAGREPFIARFCDRRVEI